MATTIKKETLGLWKALHTRFLTYRFRYVKPAKADGR